LNYSRPRIFANAKLLSGAVRGHRRRAPLKPVAAFREYLVEAVRKFVSDTASDPAAEPFDNRPWEFVGSRIIHFAGDLTDSDTYARLCEAHEATAIQYHTAGNAVFTLPSHRDCLAPSSSNWAW
jgi:hypothetical protein